MEGKGGSDNVCRHLAVSSKALSSNLILVRQRVTWQCSLVQHYSRYLGTFKRSIDVDLG